MSAWPWAALFLLGGYHGINPAMGWLFAVALGLQEKSGRAVARALPPIALGHALAIAAVLLAAGMAQAVLPVGWIRISVALILGSFGVYRLFHGRHPRYGGMQVGFGDLTFWSFLMASAHGAGFMLLPILLGLHPGPHEHLAVAGTPSMAGLAIAIHTLGYLAVTGLVAWAVYAKFGVAVLRSAWINLDLVWAVALLATAAVTLIIR